MLIQANKQYVTPELKAALSKISLYDYAQEVAVNLPPPRLDAYMDTNYDRIQWSVVRFADDVLYRIGFSQVYVSMPVLQHLQKTKIISLFLGLILNVIIFILLFLSVVLIYSLLMISVETRTFELGILRMIGTTRRGSYLHALEYWSNFSNNLTHIYRDCRPSACPSVFLRFTSTSNWPFMLARP